MSGESANLDQKSVQYLFSDRAFAMLALASATGIVYDHISTFDDEIELVWQRPKWTVVQLLFIVNRYVGDIMQIFGAVVYIRHIQRHTHAVSRPFFLPCVSDSLTTATPGVCNVLNKLVGYLVMVVLSSMQGIMIYRVSSMYSHNRKIIYLLASALLVEITCVFFVQFYAYDFHDRRSFRVHLGLWDHQSDTLFSAVPDPAPGVQLCSQNTWPDFMWAAWVPVFFFESFILALSVSLAVKYYKSIRTLHAVRQTNGMPWENSDSLVYILLRDSITFPSILTAFCFSNFFVWKFMDYLAVQISFTVTSFVPCIVGSRLIINLRETYYRPFKEECDYGIEQAQEQTQTETFESINLRRRDASGGRRSSDEAHI
ncbi:hypothetical protein CVT26_003792 [Gymnopilus dilepis]|uniref:DUF6533 domain-containing protein n=1 Tax=Gymnopilus dilepis TaxID=231916 RepID=A0A409W1N0_9AGAR|nr:hypothetical protein CVT26_003792 [Gymnopilus dilepis]